MSNITIEVRGGNIVEVYGGSQKTRVTIVDWDNWEAGETSTSVYTIDCLPTSKMPEETAKIIASPDAYREAENSKMITIKT